MKLKNSKYTTVSGYDWAFSHAEMVNSRNQAKTGKLWYQFKVLGNTFNLIPHLLKSKKLIRNGIDLCNKYKSCWHIDFRSTDYQKIIRQVTKAVITQTLLDLFFIFSERDFDNFAKKCCCKSPYTTGNTSRNTFQLVLCSTFSWENLMSY